MADPDPGCTSQAQRSWPGLAGQGPCELSALGPQAAGSPRAVAPSGLRVPRPRQPSAMSLGVFKVSASASTVGAEAQEEYVRIVGLMCQKLRAEQYHSSYFDRGAEADSRLCTPEGWFSCQVSRGPGPGRPSGHQLSSWFSGFSGPGTPGQRRERPPASRPPAGPHRSSARFPGGAAAAGRGPPSRNAGGREYAGHWGRRAPLGPLGRRVVGRGEDGFRASETWYVPRQPSR